MYVHASFVELLLGKQHNCIRVQTGLYDLNGICEPGVYQLWRADKPVLKRVYVAVVQKIFKRRLAPLRRDPIKATAVGDDRITVLFHKGSNRRKARLGGLRAPRVMVAAMQPVLIDG